MLGLMTGIEQLQTKAGLARMPVCGFDIEILSEDGKQLEEKKDGLVTVKLPMPLVVYPSMEK